MSYYRATSRSGIGTDAAMGAFRGLQAKGLVIVTKLGALGVEGVARSPSYALTEIGLPGKSPRHLYAGGIQAATFW